MCYAFEWFSDWLRYCYWSLQGSWTSRTEQWAFFVKRVDVISGIQSKMVGGKSHILRGSVSLALIILILLVIILLASEENPLRNYYNPLRNSQFSSSSSGMFIPSRLLVFSFWSWLSLSQEIIVWFCDTFWLSYSVCNFAKGKWVEDRKRPLYSGFECKQWLSTMWSCRIMGRPDFSFEGYRWQPEDCNMPQFDRFTFLRRYGSTLWFSNSEHSWTIHDSFL